MKAVTGQLPPPGDAWAAELKYDGMRVLAAIGDPGQPLRLDTTTGADAAARFPELQGLSRALAPRRVILDGEIVAWGEDGRPSFGRLQRRMHLNRPGEIARVAAEVPVVYVVFDVLWLDDEDLTALAPHRLILDGEVVAFGEDGRPSFGQLQHRMHLTRPVEIARVAARIPARYVIFDLLWLDDHDLTALPYLRRRELLADLVVPGDGWMVPAHHVGGAADLLAAATAQRLEGIVAKRVDSTYLPGKRSPLWRKVKVRPRQEFVVGGWHPGERGLAGKMGSLLVGVHQGDELRYAGKVGTGFTDHERNRLGALLDGLATDQPPFDPPPPREVGRTAQWVRPELVAEVTFAEWTGSGTLRHPSYIALRDDKDPRDVVRES